MRILKGRDSISHPQSDYHLQSLAPHSVNYSVYYSTCLITKEPASPRTTTRSLIPHTSHLPSARSKRIMLQVANAHPLGTLLVFADPSPVIPTTSTLTSAVAYSRPHIVLKPIPTGWWANSLVAKGTKPRPISTALLRPSVPLVPCLTGSEGTVLGKVPLLARSRSTGDFPVSKRGRDRRI